MTYKVFTGTYDEVQTRYFELDGKIQRDENGIEKFQIVDIMDNLQTLIYVPVVKKERKTISNKAFNAANLEADTWNLHAQSCDDGWEIVYSVPALGFKRLAFSKSKRGIILKLRKMIKKAVIEHSKKRNALA